MGARVIAEAIMASNKRANWKDMNFSGGLLAYQKIHGKGAMPLKKEDTMVQAEWKVRNHLLQIEKAWTTCNPYVSEEK